MPDQSWVKVSSPTPRATSTTPASAPLRQPAAASPSTEDSTTTRGRSKAPSSPSTSRQAGVERRAGALDARAVFNADTSVNAAANMNIGDNSNFAVTFNVGSELHANTRTVTAPHRRQRPRPPLSHGFRWRARRLSAQPLVVNNGRRLSGRLGSVDCPSLTIFGRLSPGELVGEPSARPAR